MKDAIGAFVLFLSSADIDQSGKGCFSMRMKALILSLETAMTILW